MASASLQAVIDIGQKGGGAEGRAAAPKMVLEKASHPFAMRQAQAGDATVGVPEQMQSLVRYGNAYVQMEHPFQQAMAIAGIEGAGGLAVAAGAVLTVSGAAMLSNPLTFPVGVTNIFGGLTLAYTGARVMSEGPRLVLQGNHE